MSLSCGPKIGLELRGDSHLCVKFYPSTNSDKLSDSLMHQCLLHRLRPQSFPHWRTPQRKPLTITGGIILTCLDAPLLTNGTVMVQGFGANEEKALLEKVEAPIPVVTHPSYRLGSSGL